MKKESKLEISRWLRWFLLAVAVIAVYKTFDNFSSIFSWLGNIIAILMPFVFGFVIAYFLNKPASKLEKALLKSEKFPLLAKKARAISVLSIYILTFAVISLLLSFFIPPLVKNIVELITSLPGYAKNFLNYLNKLSEEYTYLHDLQLTTRLNKLLEDTISSIKVEDITGYLQSIINVGSTVINIFLSVVISIYMLLEKESIIGVVRRFCGLFIKEKRIEDLAGYLHQADHVVYHYFVGQSLDCLIVSVFSAIGLSILGAPYAPVLGFIFGMFNIIPYFGPIISGVGVILVILVSNLQENLMLAVWCAIYLLVLQQIDANIINPRILGDALDMSPFWVIFAVTVFSGLFGFVGMIIGVPCVGILRLLFRDFITYRKKVIQEKEQIETSEG